MKRALAVLLFLWTTPGFAHDTWILPVRWQVEAGDRLTVLLTSAMDFPASETPVKPDRLLERNVRLDGTTGRLEPRLDETALELSAPAARGGIATVWITTRERSLDLTPEQVREYLEEIGASGTIGKDWRDSGRTTWRETYVKVAKTFVRVGGAGDGSWREPVGASLEMIPESDPTALRAGDSLDVRLLWRGRPLPGLAVGAVGAAPGRALLKATDESGRVSFLLDRPGPWLLRATSLRPSTTRTGEWDSVFSTITLEVKPR